MSDYWQISLNVCTLKIGVTRTPLLTYFENTLLTLDSFINALYGRGQRDSAVVLSVFVTCFKWKVLDGGIVNFQ